MRKSRSNRRDLITMRLRLLPFAVVLAVALAACTAPPPVAAVAFSSHASGQTNYGNRTIVVTAQLTGTQPDAQIDVSTNARDVTKVRTGDVLELTVELKDNANTITVSVANQGQATPDSATLTLEYPFLTLENTQAAAVVIGQPDFDTTSETATNKEFGGPYIRPLVLNGVLYLPDYGMERVMGYLQVPTTNDASADFVIGKQTFDDSTSTVGPATLSGPQTVATDGQRLYILDYSFGRITVYDTPPTTSGALADFAIGQPDLATNGTGTTATSLSYPESMTLAGGRLIVADSGNNRVLIWNEVPTAVGTPADLVLGQSDFVSGSSNAGGTTAANTLNYPTDVWSDGTRLVVLDADNNRVLIWNTFPTTDFAAADMVLGQTDFVKEGAASGAPGLAYPYSVDSNGNQLFVADANNNRVLVWNTFPTASGQPADMVLGQSDFEGSAAATSATGLAYPTGVYLDGNSLFVTDHDNYRYLIYRGAED